MIVGAALIEIHVAGSHSLKQKRGVVRSIVRRVRNRFNLSVAEVGGQGTWQRASLALGAVGSDERVLRRALENAVEFIEHLHLAEVLGSEIEILDLPQEPMFEDGEDGEDSSWRERA
jgi:hypothetical protein